MSVKSIPIIVTVILLLISSNNPTHFLKSSGKLDGVFFLGQENIASYPHGPACSQWYGWSLVSFREIARWTPSLVIFIYFKATDFRIKLKLPQQYRAGSRTMSLKVLISVLFENARKQPMAQPHQLSIF